MDPVQLAGAAAALLAASGGEAVAEAVGKRAWAEISQLRALVGRRLTHHSGDERALERAQRTPAKSDDVQRLADIIRRLVEDDPEFRAELNSLVSAAGKDSAFHPILVQLAGGAEIGKLTIFNGPVSGDISF
ncbi:hypothetical protein [Actinomadura sp. DC4]|uniref:hypothetical protein n=1 Tax=Actinomadura sp. DC4 TaxID=3055069 RepID=UPI0025B272DC|nr:hypothetical protein [Actinomadura sp. DC4]MDN3354507.1 hypothetical protein [Actinomadura sp. DC4]